MGLPNGRRRGDFDTAAQDAVRPHLLEDGILFREFESQSGLLLEGRRRRSVVNIRCSKRIEELSVSIDNGEKRRRSCGCSKRFVRCTPITVVVKR